DTALGRGGEYAELFFEHREGSNITFEQQAVKTASRSTSQGVGVRVIQGDAVGYAYSEDLSRESMRRAADTAARIAARGDRVAPVDVVHYESASHYAPSAGTVTVPAAEKVELIRRADRAARRYDASVVRVDVNFIDELKHIMVVTSDGRIAGDVQPLVRFNVSCLSERDGSRQSARWGGGGRMGMAYFNRKKTSNYTDQIGNVVASELCTVVDDGTIPDSRGSLNIDDEGNRPGYNVLIEKGVLQGYMQDRLSMKHFGVAPTGNGRRQSFRHYPMPRMTNTYMLAGDMA